MQKSSGREQHKQPDATNTTSSSTNSINSWFSPTSPNSLIITEMRSEPSLDKIAFRSAVFPVPRKPVSIVTGIRWSEAFKPLELLLGLKTVD